MKKVFVKPKEGLRVVKPETRLQLAAEGEEVIDSSYWRRREMDGDVTIEEAKVEKKEVKKAELMLAKKSGGEL